MELRKDNLYKMNFIKVYGADVTDSIQWLKIDDVRELGHRWFGYLNVNSVHVLQSLVSGINLGQISYPTFLLICEAYIRTNNVE